MGTKINQNGNIGGAISTSSLTQLQVSSTPIGSVPYGVGHSFSVQIYRKANQCTPNGSQQNGELFYHSPLSVLDVESIKNKYNPIKKKHQVMFSIEMWNEAIQEKVLKHIGVIFPNSTQNQVQIVPCEKVWLTSSMDIDGCWLDVESPPYDLTKSITYTLTCSSEEKAKEVAGILRESPEDFAKELRLFICLPSIETKKTQTRVTAESASSANLLSQLRQRYSLDISHVLMSDDATKRMLDEMTNYSVQTYDEIGEAGYQQKGFDAYQILKEMLVDKRETIKRGADEAWNSVFWVDENSRPDRVCRELNELQHKIGSEEWDQIAFEFHKEGDRKNTKGFDLNTKRSVEHQTDSQESNEGYANNSRTDDSSEKHTSSHKSTTDSKVKGEISADIELLKFKMGNAKGSYNSDKNRYQEGSNTAEKSSQRYYDDASAHRDVNNLKEAEKADQADSFSFHSSDANKELDSSRESSKKARKQLEDNKNHIEWDGEKFVPKEMNLNRINLTKIQSKQVFEDLRIRASRTVTSICMSIKILNQRNFEMEIKMLQEEIDAKEKEANNRKRVIQEMEMEINKLKQDRLVEVSKINAMIREKELEIENLKQEKLNDIANKNAVIHTMLSELLHPVLKKMSLNPNLEETATLLKDLFKRAYFRFYDKDGNGFISLSEFRDVKNSLCKLTGKKLPKEDDIIAFFKSIDTDDDGQITFEEFAERVHLN